MTSRLHDVPTVSSCVAQLVVDISTLPDARQHELAVGLLTDEIVLPLEALRAHLKDAPGRVPRYAALIVRGRTRGQAGTRLVLILNT